MMMGGMKGMQRPEPSKMADNLFSKLDTKGQGYIEKSDLQSAFDQVSSKNASGAGASVDDVFAALDGDSDGKVTKQEMSDSVQKLADQLDSQFQSMRMGKGGGMGMMGGMAGAGGMTKGDISSMADSTGNSAQMMDSLLANFDASDTDQDGKISAQEAMAFQDLTNQDLTQTASASSGTQSSDAKIMQQIIELARSYSESSQYGQNNSSTISVSA